MERSNFASAVSSLGRIDVEPEGSASAACQVLRPGHSDLHPARPWPSIPRPFLG
ncbi:MAG: hypothetical protein AVDCRST_MAG62-1456 [uncultured Sphingomonas sp.]|uniref:Uncharacterized protein n=1 Tax=uncultured Sphingomonas sp. TaxID=158754 RepID=A0A6J4TKN0_9SPHN|nr:MAG: hypothetical protein AVDCRST_MAG62-1456 [uncultured Sphingomonas sp.]